MSNWLIYRFTNEKTTQIHNNWAWIQETTSAKLEIDLVVYVIKETNFPCSDKKNIEQNLYSEF